MTAEPGKMTDQQLLDHAATLTDEQLSDFYASVDAAEILSKQRTIDLGAAALWYAEALRWPVFPLLERGKRPLTAHGFKDATTDAEQIRAWWTRWPTANIGTPTGAGGCGYDVIDVDGVPGFTSLAEMKHSNCPPDCCAVTFCPALGELPQPRALAMTPGDKAKRRSAGRHYFIDPTGDGNGTALAEGIDYRGRGGFVVLAPSVGPDGNRYSWITRP